MKIVVTDACIGCGACAAIAEKYFDIKGGKAVPKNLVKKEDEQKVKEASDACPVSAIKLE